MAFRSFCAIALLVFSACCASDPSPVALPAAREQPYRVLL